MQLNFSTRYQINFDSIRSEQVARYDGFIGRIMGFFGWAIEVKKGDKSFYLNKNSIVRRIIPFLNNSEEKVEDLKKRIFPEKRSFTEGELKRYLFGFLPAAVELKPMPRVNLEEQKRRSELNIQREILLELQQGDLANLKGKLEMQNEAILSNLKSSGKTTFFLKGLFENEKDDLIPDAELKKHLTGDNLQLAIETRSDIRNVKAMIVYFDQPDLVEGGIRQKESEIKALQAQLKKQEEQIQDVTLNIEKEIEDLENYEELLKEQEAELHEWKNLWKIGELQEIKNKEAKAEQELHMARGSLIQAAADRSNQIMNLGASPEGMAIGRLNGEIAVLRKLKMITDNLSDSSS